MVLSTSQIMTSSTLVCRHQSFLAIPIQRLPRSIVICMRFYAHPGNLLLSFRRLPTSLRRCLTIMLAPKLSSYSLMHIQPLLPAISTTLLQWSSYMHQLLSLSPLISATPTQWPQPLTLPLLPLLPTKLHWLSLSLRVRRTWPRSRNATAPLLLLRHHIHHLLQQSALVALSSTVISMVTTTAMPAPTANFSWAAHNSTPLNTSMQRIPLPLPEATLTPSVDGLVKAKAV